MPPKANSNPPAPRQRRRALQPEGPRDLRSHTRGGPSGPIYSGLEHGRPSRIRNEPLRVDRTFTFMSAHNRAPPALHLRRRYPVPRRPPVFNPPTYREVRYLDQLLGGGPITQSFFSFLNRAEYDNLRATSRHAARLLKPYNGDANGERHREIASLAEGIHCENSHYQPRRLNQTPADLARDAAPLVYRDLPRGVRWRCLKVPATTVNANPPVIYSKCDGTRLGLNRNFHPEAFTVCSDCARFAQDDFDPFVWDDATILPLCYHCSLGRMDTPQWTACVCHCRFRSDPLNPVLGFSRVYLCTDCRQLLYRVLMRRALNKVNNTRYYNLRPRLLDIVPFNTISDPLRKYVNDWHDTNRNFCLCGLDWASIKDSYPKTSRLNPATGNMQLVPDVRWVFRMCLICDTHVVHKPLAADSKCI